MRNLKGYTMIGAIAGDIIGSIYEFHNHRSKEFPLFGPQVFFTDDTAMSLAVAKAILEANGRLGILGDLTVKYMQEIGKKYPDASYGNSFQNWLKSDNPKPYLSYGNGAAMRVSPCAFSSSSLEETLEVTRLVTEVTHNHSEGLKGAEATSVCIFLAKSGLSQEALAERVARDYYDLGFSLSQIRPSYRFDETCQGTVPQAIKAFLEGVSFEDSIRGAISIGGDSDTIAAITGGIAEAYFGVPANIRDEAEKRLDSYLLEILREFESKYQPNSRALRTQD
jgi:type I restriction enzyme M protein